MRQLIALIAAICLIAYAVPAYAENRFIIPVDDGLDRLLERAQVHASKGAWVDCVETYLKVLEERPGRVVLRAGQTYIGVEDLVWETLSALPGEGKEALSRRIDPVAEGRYRDAAEHGDLAALVAVAERFRLARVADDALMLAADLHLERGEIEDAARLYLRLEERYPASSRLGPVFELKQAYVRGWLRGRTAVKPELDAAQARYDPERVEIAGSRLDLAEAGRRVLRSLPAKGLAERPELGGMLSLGRPGRNAVQDGALYFGPRLWLGEVTTFEGQPESREIKWGQGGTMVRTPGTPPGGGESAFPFIPAVAEQTVYVSSNNSLLAFDLETGRRSVSFERPNRITFEDNNALTTYAPTLDGDRLYGNFVTELLSGEDWQGFPIKVAIPLRDLFCYDRKTGRKLWSVAAKLGVDSDAKVRPSFPEPPLLLGGRLYLAATLMEGFVKGYVYCVDAATGKLVWKTWVVSGQVEATMFGYPAREPLCSMLAADDDGTVYYASGLGCVAALDAGDGRIKWISTYDQIPIEATSGYHPIHRQIPWRNNPPLVGPEAVYVAPLDSENLYAYDRHTGQLLFRFDLRFRDDGLRYLAGLHQGKLVLTGNRVLALDAITGRVMDGPADLDGSNPAGRPLIAGGVLHVPTMGKVFHLDLDKWRMNGETEWSTAEHAGGVFASGAYTIVLSRMVHPSEQRRTNQGTTLSVFKNEPPPAATGEKKKP